MRKVIWLMHSSMDGYIADKDGGISWIMVDDEMFDDVQRLVENADTALYGRVTYQMMAAYWPTAGNKPDATKHDIEHSRWSNAAHKLVFSRTLKKADWHGTTIIRDNIKEEVEKLKKQPGKNMILFASPGLASTLMNMDLIDELWFNINPVVLGAGKPLFQQVAERHNLKLLSTKTYKNGVIMLHYNVRRND